MFTKEELMLLRVALLQYEPSNKRVYESAYIKIIAALNNDEKEK